MTTNRTDRISKIEKLSGDLQQTDLLVISQNTTGTTYKTANIPSSTHYNISRDKMQSLGISSFIYMGEGLTGDGLVSNPLILNKSWLDKLLIRKETIQFTRVGNRKTRYLPIARVPLFQSQYFMSWVAKAIYVANVEDTGELLLVQPATFAHSVSVGDWSARRNLDSLQVIERKIEPTGLPTGYAFSGFQSASYTAGIVSLTSVTGVTPEFWYVDLDKGSLKEDSISGLSRLNIGSAGWGEGSYSQNSFSAFSTSTGRYYLVVDRPSDWLSNPNLGINIRCYRINGTGTTATTTEITSWTVSSYAGLFTNQTTLKVSDKFVGSGTEKCELNSTDNPTVGFMAAFQQNTRLQVIQNPDNVDDVYLIIRREHYIGYGNSGYQPYVADLVLKLNITAEGAGTAFAIDRYLSNRPALALVNDVMTFTNKRETFRSSDIDADSSEYMHILSDGSILLVEDRVQKAKGYIRVRKSPPGWTAMSVLDIHNAAISQSMGVDQIINPAPQYTDTVAATHKVYISSPINVHMGMVDFTIPAQVLDVTSVINNQTDTVVGNIPYSDGVYSSLSCRVVYIYAQYSGSNTTLITSSTQINESLSNTLIASYYVPTDGSSPLIVGQSYSRFGKYRLSYHPQGCAVPVSYDNPAQSPKQYWLQFGQSNQGKPTFWTDSAASTSPVNYGVNGTTIYIRSDITATQNQQFRMVFNGVDLGVKTWSGSAMIWSTTLTNTGTADLVDQPAVLYDVSTGNEISRSYLGVLKTPFIVDVVNTNNSDDVITDTIQGFDCYIRIRPLAVAIGNSIRISVAPPGSSTATLLSTQTNQGFPIYVQYTPSSVGVYSIIVQDTTADPNGTSMVTKTLNVYSSLQLYNTAGSYTVTIPSGVKATFEVSGGGGGGGLSAYSGGSNYPDGQTGQSAAVWNFLHASIPAGAISFFAYGGKGGGPGIWGNGSSFQNGTRNDGGTVTSSGTDLPSMSNTTITTGAKGVEVGRYTQQPGGVGIVTAAGTQNSGGTGAWGIGDERWSYGGGGAAGGYAIFTFTNIYSDAVNFNVSVDWLSSTTQQGLGARGHNNSDTYSGGTGAGSTVVVKLAKA